MEDRSRRPLITGAGGGSFAAKEVHPAADPVIAPVLAVTLPALGLRLNASDHAGFVSLRDVFAGDDAGAVVPIEDPPGEGGSSKTVRLVDPQAPALYSEQR
jgi:hypothetical protein